VGFIYVFLCHVHVDSTIIFCVVCRLVAKLARTLGKLRLKQSLGLQELAFRYNSAYSLIIYGNVAAVVG